MNNNDDDLQNMDQNIAIDPGANNANIAVDAEVVMEEVDGNVGEDVADVVDVDEDNMEVIGDVAADENVAGNIGMEMVLDTLEGINNQFGTMMDIMNSQYEDVRQGFVETHNTIEQLSRQTEEISIRVSRTDDAVTTLRQQQIDMQKKIAKIRKTPTPDVTTNIPRSEILQRSNRVLFSTPHSPVTYMRPSDTPRVQETVNQTLENLEHDEHQFRTKLTYKGHKLNSLKEDKEGFGVSLDHYAGHTRTLIEFYTGVASLVKIPSVANKFNLLYREVKNLYGTGPDAIEKLWSRYRAMLGLSKGTDQVSWQVESLRSGPIIWPPESTDIDDFIFLIKSRAYRPPTEDEAPIPEILHLLGTILPRNLSEELDGLRLDQRYMAQEPNLDLVLKEWLKAKLRIVKLRRADKRNSNGHPKANNAKRKFSETNTSSTSFKKRKNTEKKNNSIPADEFNALKDELTKKGWYDFRKENKLCLKCGSNRHMLTQCRSKEISNYYKAPVDSNPSTRSQNVNYVASEKFLQPPPRNWN